MGKRAEQARIYFSNPSRYLSEGYNLRIRKETVLYLTRDMHFNHILDAPCGDGSVSLQLLAQCDHLTLVDFSKNMLDIADAQIPDRHRSRVKLIHSDIYKLRLPKNSCDLIICLGVLSHVDDPEALLGALLPLLKPGGYFILQNTDAKHWFGLLIRIYGWVRSFLFKQAYPHRPVSSALIASIMQKQGLLLSKEYRYNQSFLGFGRLFKSRHKYALTRWFFGDVSSPKHQAWGSDHIYQYVLQRD